MEVSQNYHCFLQIGPTEWLQVNFFWQGMQKWHVREGMPPSTGTRLDYTNWPMIMNCKVFYWIISACTFPAHPCLLKEYIQLFMIYSTVYDVHVTRQTMVSDIEWTDNLQKIWNRIMQELKSRSTIILRNLMETLGCGTYPYLSRLLNNAWSKQMYWKNSISCWDWQKSHLDNKNSLPAQWYQRVAYIM